MTGRIPETGSLRKVIDTSTMCSCKVRLPKYCTLPYYARPSGLSWGSAGSTAYCLLNTDKLLPHRVGSSVGAVWGAGMETCV